eukprot:3524775-Prymnesium_polylepis.1
MPSRRRASAHSASRCRELTVQQRSQLLGPSGLSRGSGPSSKHTSGCALPERPARRPPPRSSPRAAARIASRRAAAGRMSPL